MRKEFFMAVVATGTLWVSTLHGQPATLVTGTSSTMRNQPGPTEGASVSQPTSRLDRLVGAAWRGIDIERDRAGLEDGCEMSTKAIHVVTFGPRSGGTVRGTMVSKVEIEPAGRDEDEVPCGRKYKAYKFQVRRSVAIGEFDDNYLSETDSNGVCEGACPKSITAGETFALRFTKDQPVRQRQSCRRYPDTVTLFFMGACSHGSATLESWDDEYRRVEEDGTVVTFHRNVTDSAEK